MKKAIRKQLLRERKSLSQLEVEEKSEKITQTLIDSKLLENAESVHLYYPINKEVNTLRIIEFLWQNEIKVIMPRTNFENRDLINYEITDLSQLEKTTFNMLEPKIDGRVFNGSPDVVLVPGVGFDTNRNRMGYGGGFYDRFLQNSESNKIALAYECQIYDELPVETHDIKMDKIITEERII